MSKDLIIGIHSVGAALKNPNRSDFELVFTDEGKKELISRTSLSAKDIESIPHEVVNKHEFQELGKKEFKELDLEYQRIPSGVFLKSSPLDILGANELYEACIESDQIRVLCLDGVTDVHNAAAILRTASFYKIDLILVSGKSRFRMTPGFFRIASGASEFIRMIQVPSLPKVISKLIDMGIDTIALSEHEAEHSLDAATKSCLILGSEEKGISNAVLRLCKKRLRLNSQGNIKSLNVSVAAAVAMQIAYGRSY